MENERIGNMEAIKCYKCDHCKFICNKAEHMKRHYLQNHKKTNIILTEGIIGEETCVETYIRSIEDEKRRHIEEEEKRIQAFINMPYEQKLNNVNSIIENITATNDVDIIKSAQKDLSQYIGYLDTVEDKLIYAVINGYENKAINKMGAIEYGTTPQSEEASYAESIAKLLHIDTNDYIFLNRGHKEQMKSNFMIRCPYCEICCSEANWMKCHIKNIHHKQNMLNELGYVWTYSTSDIKHAMETATTYFKEMECYRCNECGFQNTEEKEVISHINHKHKQIKGRKKPSILYGIVGNSKEAYAAYDIKFFIQPFSPQKMEPMSPEMDIFLRNRDSKETQTEIPKKCDIGIAPEGLKGGVRNKHQKDRPNDRLPSSMREVDLHFNYPLLRIRRNLKATNIGCINSSTSVT